MAKIPFRLKRIAEAFAAVPQTRFCLSSGSEHSAKNSVELSDLINSFIERDERSEGNEEDEDKREKETKSSDLENYRSVSETKEMLQSLLGCNLSKGVEEDDVKLTILEETKLACRVIGTTSHEGFKRQLMSRLREKGFDAGLCKSRWKKIGRFPAGNYEYIDIVDVKTRYIVELALAEEFTIARPTNDYQSLLDVFPNIFVGKTKEVKQVVRLMCTAAKESLKNRDMHVPPWRKNGFMQAKWSSSYKRATNAISGNVASDSGYVTAEKRSVGFETSPGILSYCRGEIVMKRLRVGNLALELNGM